MKNPTYAKLAGLFTELEPVRTLIESYDEFTAEKARLLVMRPKVAEEIEALVKRIAPEDSKGLSLIAGLRNKRTVIDHRLKQIEEQLLDIKCKLANPLDLATSRLREETHRLQAAEQLKVENFLSPLITDLERLAVSVGTVMGHHDFAGFFSNLESGPWNGGDQSSRARSLFGLFEELIALKSNLANLAKK